MVHSKYGKVALCLNGAGAKGGVQAGAIQAFVDNGVDFDELYGSSAGALNGALLHQGSLSLMKELWTTIRNQDVYKWTPANLLDPLSNKACLYDSSPLLKTIQNHVNVESVLANPKHFYIAATDYSNWFPYVPEIRDIGKEDIHTFLYASASPPIYFPFVDYHGLKLADAGILSNYCIRTAVHNGADTIVVIGFAYADPSDPRNIADSIGETVGVSLYGQFLDELSIIESINKLVPYIPVSVGKRLIKLVSIIPPKPLGIGLLDFDLQGRSREDLWSYGYNLAQGILEKELCS